MLGDFLQYYFFINKIKNISNKDIYNFGVYKGESLEHQDIILRDNKLKPNNIYAFDSFTGLPKETENIPIYEGHEEGMFDMKDNIDNIIFNIKKRLKYNKITHIIQGYFNDILNDNLLKLYDLKPAFLVELDCDLHASTIQALEFLINNKLIIKDTLLYYNDWGGLDEYTGGESLAHKEICEKYNIDCKLIFDKGDGKPHREKAFQIIKIGG